MEVLPLPTDADVVIISMRQTLCDGDEEFGIHHEEQFSLRIPGRRECNCPVVTVSSASQDIKQWLTQVLHLLPGRLKKPVKSGYQAVLDSSSSFIAGPFEETRVINQQLGGKSFIGHHGLYNYKFDCSEVDNLPDVEFIVNGQKLSLSGRDYTARMKLNGEDVCASRILAMGWRKNDEPDWVLGMNFMRAYCTQFDKGNHRIGFEKTYSYEDIITREPL
ncbi:lysosomal aspartic protease [Plakobranchus ocellatus]|uniref:Lysosomal aspartic protease n=1 Tax=Plakobranchus ocellatus TaxID=259542 RepID=A0AAV3ZL87_9GAST|nr:lysosomal aspartic protease [Plakobranchus ocellatus]